MEYYYQFWTSVPNFYLHMVDELLKQVCRAVGPTVAVHLESLGLMFTI